MVELALNGPSTKRLAAVHQSLETNPLAQKQPAREGCRASVTPIATAVDVAVVTSVGFVYTLAILVTSVMSVTRDRHDNSTDHNGNDDCDGHVNSDNQDAQGVPDPAFCGQRGLRMIDVDGVSYPTLAEAAVFLKVSRNAVSRYINEGILPTPSTVRQGTRVVNVFPDDYLKNARRYLEEYSRTHVARFKSTKEERGS